jgi:hypothetical protein
MSTTQTVRLFAPTGVGGLIQAPGGNYPVLSDGTVTVNAADVQYLMALGFEYAVIEHRVYTTAGAPVAQSTSQTVGSTSLTVGSLTIAAQPDTPRQLQAIVYPGGAITAGVLTLTYTANDGTTQVDALSLIMASQTAGTAGATLATTKGVERIASAVVSGLTGGVSPGIQIGTNNYVAVPVPPRFVDFVVNYEKKISFTAGTLGLSVPSDDTVPTLLNTAGALITPTTVPNGTNWLSFGYTFVFPG